MIVFKPKLWPGVSAAILVAAAGGGLAACQGEAGEKGKAEAAGEGGEAAAAPAQAAGEGGESASGEAGEKGAQGAYSNIPASSKPGLHLAHLKGFFLVAQKQTQGPDYAAALAGQGMLEAFDKEAAEFRTWGVDEALLRKAAQSGAAADLAAATANIEAAQKKIGGDQAAIAKAMVDIAAGLYGEVEKDGAVDAIEYQHALGAALSADDVVRRSNDPRANAARPELKKLLALWPAPQAPDKVTPKSQVMAQASRVELELS
ncbi:MAG: hypothetical protein ACXWVJ_06540 [Caulobacteraceae bacterium]